MRVLLQRVSTASVSVSDKVIAQIGRGLLLFVALERGDERKRAAQMANRIVNYRVFADDRGKMNLSLIATGGELLAVPQFTLAADTSRGMRPDFGPAMPPVEASSLFDYFLQQLQDLSVAVCSGRFGADMQVSLNNDGPVTLMLTNGIPAN